MKHQLTPDIYKLTKFFTIIKNISSKSTLQKSVHKTHLNIKHILTIPHPIIPDL